MYYKGVSDGKGGNGQKERKINLSIFIFILHNIISPLSGSTHNLKTGDKFVMYVILIREKEKWTNKGNDKHEKADSLLHNTISHTKFQNPKSSSS